jgi:virulence-associated protein VapD
LGELVSSKVNASDLWDELDFFADQLDELRLIDLENNHDFVPIINNRHFPIDEKRIVEVY